MTWLAVALGGALGAVARVVLAARLGGGRATPATVAVVNLAGALLAGVAAGALIAQRWPQWLALGATTGLLGAFTTYSTWGVDVVGRWRAGARARAVGLALGLLVAGVALAWVGLRLGGRVPGP